MKRTTKEKMGACTTKQKRAFYEMFPDEDKNDFYNASYESAISSLS